MCQWVYGLFWDTILTWPERSFQTCIRTREGAALPSATQPLDYWIARDTYSHGMQAIRVVFTSSAVGRTTAAITDLISSSVTATLAKVSLRYGDLFVFSWHKKAVEVDSQVYSFNLPAKSAQFNISFDASSVKHVIVLSVVGWWNVNNKTW